MFNIRMMIPDEPVQSIQLPGVPRVGDLIGAHIQYRVESVTWYPGESRVLIGVSEAWE